MNPGRSDLKEKKSKKRNGETRVWSWDLWIAKLMIYHWAIESIHYSRWKRLIMPFYHHNQCSFKLSFCHLEILKKILIFSKISHWISIFSIITIYSYHKRIPDGLKIVPYLFWVISPILDSVRVESNCVERVPIRAQCGTRGIYHFSRDCTTRQY